MREGHVAITKTAVCFCFVVFTFGAMIIFTTCSTNVRDRLCAYDCATCWPDGTRENVLKN